MVVYEGGPNERITSGPIYSTQLSILLAVDAVDFRRGIDGPCGVCRDVLDEGPFSGAAFAFRNTSSTSIKILAFDGAGMWLCLRRLSRGRLAWWPSTSGERLHPLATAVLAVLLAAGDPSRARFADQWRSLPKAAPQAEGRERASSSS